MLPSLILAFLSFSIENCKSELPSQPTLDNCLNKFLCDPESLLKPNEILSLRSQIQKIGDLSTDICTFMNISSHQGYVLTVIITKAIDESLPEWFADRPNLQDFAESTRILGNIGDCDNDGVIVICFMCEPNKIWLSHGEIFEQHLPVANMLPTVLKAEQMLKSNRKVFASIQAILRVYYKFLSTTNETISFMPNKYYLDDDSGATPVFKILILTVIFSVSLLLCVVYLWCKNYSNQLILIRLDTDIDRAKKRAEAHTLMLAKYSRDELLISVPSLEGLI